LLLDEPSFGLAPIVVEEVFALLERIKQDQRLSIFLVEQNANLALALSDRAYLLETGRVVMEGPAAELAKDEAIRRAYLGF
jgi:branched-chain amino acid transport system ATP-binding protein